MRDAVRECGVDVVPGEKTVDEAGGETVAAAHAVVDLETVEARPHVEASSGTAHGRPVVHRRRAGAAESGGGEVKTRVVVEHALEQPLVGERVEVEQALVDAVELVPQRRREVLLVAEQHVDELHELAVDLSRPLRAADRLPERRPVVEVERDDGPVLPGRGHRLAGDVGCRLGEGAEDAAGVEPAGTVDAENPLPVDLALTELRGGAVTAVGNSERAAHTEAALREV